LKGDALPKRLKLLSWGDNDSTVGKFTVNQKTADGIARQGKLGFERVAIDFNHCSVPGDDTYKELLKAGQPPLIFGYGRPNVISGDGLFLEEIAWTPLGVQHAKNFEDLSPALHDVAGEVDGLHSVALTPNGKVTGLQFFSASGSTTGPDEEGEKMPGKKDGGHSSPPHGYPENPDHYADPKNFKYPLDTEEHAKAAWDYISQDKNQEGYNAKELAFMEGRIKKACKNFGVKCESSGESGGSKMSASETMKTISLTLLAAALGLPDTSEEKTVMDTLATRLKPADAGELTKLSADIAALNKRLDDQAKAGTDAERDQILTKLSADGKAPVNPDTTKPYSREELLKMGVPTLKLLAANTPVTVPLSARGLTSQVDGAKTFVQKDKDGRVTGVDMAGLFNSENARNGQTAPTVLN
jgi:phage I-like protein